MAKEKVITLEPIKVHNVTVHIEGDTDLVLNKMNARTIRILTDIREDKGKKIQEKPNEWEDIITAIHWRDKLPTEDTYNDCDEDMLHELLANNAPCITAFGLKQSFCQAVVRNEIDKYSTKFKNAINILGVNGLVPIKFAGYSIDKRLMSPKKGAPVLCRLSHFSGWSADIPLSYTDHVYSIDEIINIINMAGFGMGIGSGTSSGYGRYHVTGVM